MSLKDAALSGGDTLNQLAGFTGLGWTTSTLIFLSTFFQPGNSPVGRLGADPEVFLYFGVVFFLTTLLLDRLTATRSPHRRSTPTPVPGSRRFREDAPTRPAQGRSVAPSQNHSYSSISGPSFS